MRADRDPTRASLIRALLTTIAIATVAAIVVAADPAETRLIVQIAVTLVGMVAVWTAVRALRSAAPLAPGSPLDGNRAVPGPTLPALPIDLVRIERQLAAAAASASDARRALGPLTAAIAADRLRSRAHGSIDRDSVFAHLPEPVSPPFALVVDPALAALDTRAMPGLDSDGVAALVRALERLA
jgi:hypothetical protein